MRISMLNTLPLVLCTIGCALGGGSEQIGGLLPPLLRGLASINSVQKLAVQTEDNDVAKAIARTFDETLLDTDFSIPENIILIERDVLQIYNTSWALFESQLLSSLLNRLPQEIFSVKVVGTPDTRPFYVMKGNNPVENADSGNLESASKVLIVQVTERPTNPLPLELPVGNNQYMLAGIIVKRQGQPLELVYNPAKSYDEWSTKIANLNDQNLQSRAHILFYVLRDEEIKEVRNLTYAPPVLDTANILDQALEVDANSFSNTDHAIGAGNIDFDYDAPRPVPETPNIFRQPGADPHLNRNPHQDYYAANRPHGAHNVPEEDDTALIIWLSVGLALLMTVSVVLLTAYRKRRALDAKAIDCPIPTDPVLAPTVATSVKSVDI